MKQPHFHDGKKGIALAVRVIPRATHDEIVEILNDGSIKVRLNSSPDDAELNQKLQKFLSSILSVPDRNIEIVAGYNNRSKLVSIINLDSETAQKIILQNIA